MLELLILAAAGLVGAFMRSFVTKGQATWSRATIGECFVGLLTGLLYYVLVEPMVGKIIDLPKVADWRVGITMRAALLALIAYVLGDIVSNRLPGLLGRQAPPAPPGG